MSDEDHSGSAEFQRERSGQRGATADERTRLVGSSWRADTSAQPAAQTAAGQIAIGFVLNGIYRVDRLIGQGGMGEVYEGTEVATEKRVAIKIILPQLAADPDVQGLFRNEAHALMQLSHPGLVQYRLLAQEPELKVLYIVTEFVDGPSLSDALDAPNDLKRREHSAALLTRLLERLASALAVAHGLGIIHRDISPDNVLLPHGNLEKAKIIDFGIAKNLGADGKTIVGSGFAGKLTYVAPEQFRGSREVGPWTDIYSLALVALAVAAGRTPDMGSNFAEAVEKRKRIPDLTAAPAGLRPVIARMLQPDPRDRYRSMDEVLAALAQAKQDEQPAPKPRAPIAPPPIPPKSAARIKRSAIGRVLVASTAAGGVALAAAWFLLTTRHHASLTPATRPHIAKQVATAAPPPAVRPNDVEQVKQALSPMLTRINCSWLDMEEPHPTARGVQITLSGVAGSAQAVNEAVSSRLNPLGISYDLNTTQIGPVQSSACRVLDALREFRAPPGERAVTLPQPVYHLGVWKECNQQGKTGPAAKVVVNISLPKPPDDFALGSVQPDGRIGLTFGNRKSFSAYLRRLAAVGHPIAAKAIANPSKFTPTLCVRKPMLGAWLLIKGTGPIAAGLPVDFTGRRTISVGREWPRMFAEKARRHHWVTDLGWFQVAQ